MADIFDHLLDDTPEPLVTPWEDHGPFSMLLHNTCVAVIWHDPPHGVLRISAGEGLTLGQGTVRELQAKVEQALRSGRTAWERLLDEDYTPETLPPLPAPAEPPGPSRTLARRKAQDLGIALLGDDE